MVKQLSRFLIWLSKRSCRLEQWLLYYYILLCCLKSSLMEQRLCCCLFSKGYNSSRSKLVAWGGAITTLSKTLYFGSRQAVMKIDGVLLYFPVLLNSHFTCKKEAECSLGTDLFSYCLYVQWRIRNFFVYRLLPSLV